MKEGNVLRKNGQYNILKTIEELTELSEVLIKRVNKGNERISNESIEQEIAGVLIQIVSLLNVEGIDEKRILKFITFCIY